MCPVNDLLSTPILPRHFAIQFQHSTELFAPFAVLVLRKLCPPSKLAQLIGHGPARRRLILVCLLYYWPLGLHSRIRLASLGAMRPAHNMVN